ncbi:MAG: hypothetical protein ACOX1I_00035 [Dethiobacteria bacterium]
MRYIKGFLGRLSEFQMSRILKEEQAKRQEQEPSPFLQNARTGTVLALAPAPH